MSVKYFRCTCEDGEDGRPSCNMMYRYDRDNNLFEHINTEPGYHMIWTEVQESFEEMGQFMEEISEEEAFLRLL